MAVGETFKVNVLPAQIAAFELAKGFGNEFMVTFVVAVALQPLASVTLIV